MLRHSPPYPLLIDSNSRSLRPCDTVFNTVKAKELPDNMSCNLLRMMTCEVPVALRPTVRRAWYLRGRFPVGAFTNKQTRELLIWCPFWLLAVGFAVYPVAMVGRYLFVSEHRRRHRLCLVCGYDLTGNESGVCPECGTKTEAPARGSEV